MESKKDPQPVGEGTSKTGPRRPYTAPTLTEYGSVARLTQGTGATRSGDGGQMMRV